MCLVISAVFLALAYSFYEDSNMQAAALCLTVALVFILLMIRNIFKTKEERKNKK